MKLAAAVCAVALSTMAGAADGTAAQGGASRGAVLVTRTAYVMGTTVRLDTRALSREQGLAKLNAALAAIEATEAELSTWREDSTISTLNRTPVGAPVRIEPHLCRMFGDIYDWNAATEGAFDPAIGALIEAWDIHGAGRRPGADDILRARRRSGLRQLGLVSLESGGCAVTRHADVTIDAGGFGKGEALDRAAAALTGEAWMIDLGGQVSVGGPAGSDPWPIAVAHPVYRDRPALELQLKSGSLSTSGGSERDVEAGGMRIGHILDPRTGSPAAFAASATVWHERGVVADILSTALYVMGPEKGLAWAEAKGIGVLYLVPELEGVRIVSSPAFQRLLD